MLGSISNKAQNAGLEILTFRPRAESFQEFYAEVPVDITVKGNYHETIDFFDNVGRLDRLINIDNIGFKNPTINGERVFVETTTVATAYRFLNEAERNRQYDCSCMQNFPPERTLRAPVIFVCDGTWRTKS